MSSPHTARTSTMRPRSPPTARREPRSFRSEPAEQPCDDVMLPSAREPGEPQQPASGPADPPAGGPVLHPRPSRPASPHLPPGRRRAPGPFQVDSCPHNSGSRVSRTRCSSYPAGEPGPWCRASGCGVSHFSTAGAVARHDASPTVELSNGRGLSIPTRRWHFAGLGRTADGCTDSPPGVRRRERWVTPPAQT
jgi:hypothetical protein